MSIINNNIVSGSFCATGSHSPSGSIGTSGSPGFVIGNIGPSGLSGVSGMAGYYGTSVPTCVCEYCELRFFYSEVTRAVRVNAAGMDYMIFICKSCNREQKIESLVSD